MSRMPGANWKPLAADWAAQPKMRAHNIVCIHTMVGGLEGTDSLFRVTNGPGFVGTESHYGTSWDGRVVQWQDTAYQAEANYLGNGEVISIENADFGTGFPKWNGSDVPAFTPQQVEAIAQILAWECSPAAHAACPPSWACHQSGIPLELIPDSKPGRRGIAPHRWGVPGYMVPGGVQWSTSKGKACPGDRRIAQIPQIIARAKAIRGGAAAPPIPSGDDDMFLVQTPDKAVWKITDYDVTMEPGIYRMGALAKARRIGVDEITPITQEELNDNIADANARRGRLLTDVAKAAGGDVDESLIVAGLLPKLSAALSTLPSRDGGLTVDDVEKAVRKVFGDAATV